MKKAILRKICLPSILCMSLISLLYFPMVCNGAEYEVSFDFSPNIINISSARLGDVRVLTDMRYSFFVANGHSIFIYFNECVDSVPNIKATRDSLGNLILRFSIEDLLSVKDCLVVDSLNEAKVVITMINGDEYIGTGATFINDKKAP